MDCRHIQFRDCSEALDLSQLQRLFQVGAFWAADRNLEDLAIAIANSDPVISVWDDNK
ncbi:MAG: GNAT family N-acetyltransferase, partial [Kamptonema sp. SIO4C4]|nr:GNAT family N-acetyltransferase [Kamptonema sp. SIO4C4]